MQNSEIIYEQGNTIVQLEPYLLPHSAKYRDQANEILQRREVWFRKIVAIDASEHSNAIDVIDDWNYLETGLLHPSGVDGLIFHTNNSIEGILPVADCAAIAAIHRTKALYALVHAGYKSVAGFSVQKNKDRHDTSILENMSVDLLRIGKLSNFDEMDFFVSPMAGVKFELPQDYAQRVFWKLFATYDLDEADFFLPHDEESTKIYLDLRSIIKAVLSKFGITSSQIHFDHRDTDNPDTNLPSHRLHTIAKGLTKKGSSIGLLENDWDMFTPSEMLTFFKARQIPISQQEKNLILSGKVWLYAEADYRLGWHIIHESGQKPVAPFSTTMWAEQWVFLPSM